MRCNHAGDEKDSRCMARFFSSQFHFRGRYFVHAFILNNQPFGKEEDQ